MDNNIGFQNAGGVFIFGRKFDIVELYHPINYNLISANSLIPDVRNSSPPLWPEG